MAGTKISALTSLSVVSDSVIIPVVDGGINYKTTATALKTYIGTYGDSNVAAYLSTNVPTGTYSDSNVAAYIAAHPGAGEIQVDWNQSTVGNVAYIKNKPDLSVYATTTNLQTLNANVGAFETYANATFSTSTYGNTQVIANLKYLTTNVITTANVQAANLVQTATGQITTPAGTNGNITLNPDGTGWVVVTSITPAWFGNTVTMTNALTVKDVRDTVYDLGTTGGTIAPNGANGDIQTITLNAGLTLNGFTNPVTGQTITLIINQGTGGFAMTSSMKFAGGYKTLSTAAGAVDIIHISYIGGTYYASLVTGYV